VTISESAQAVQVLSTLNQDGSRRWLRPRLSRGRFLNRRRTVGYGLIALFALIPQLKMGGKPLILLDVPRREFTFFGSTFLPTDTLLLSLLMIGIFLLIFLLTALLGRVWCGWACPQTVYLELVFRPIERFFEGEPGKRRPGGGLGVRKALKWIAYLLVSMFLAHTFLAYFVGVDRLAVWVRQSPLEHPASFMIMLAVTGLMLFDFGLFREQLCIVACPYGRFQSVMLDRDTLIIGYDQQRGEPRGKVRRSAHNGQSRGVALPVLEDSCGDCVDCMLCVQTCPTGIDIRNGLQMECIGCAQCIDACDAVMAKLGRARGLIRYSSQAAIEGRGRRVLRPRIVIYPLALAVVATVFAMVLMNKGAADVTILRGPGMPFNVLPSGAIANQIRVKVTNRGGEPEHYTIEVLDPRLTLNADENPMMVAPREPRTQGVLVIAPADAFAEGALSVRFRIAGEGGFSREITYRLLGPQGQNSQHGGTP
jgi:cytochrome c oxidase accessory protein FixG